MIEKPTAAAGVIPTARGRVLVVDDDPAMRTSLEAILGFDFAVTTAQSVALAEEALAAAQFDVVLTDYEMPGASGLDLVKMVNTRYPGVMVILLTGYANIAELQTSETVQSIARVLSKPFDAKRLISWVTTTVKLARMSQATSRIAMRPGRAVARTPSLDSKPYPMPVVVLCPAAAPRDGYRSQLIGFANANGYTGADVSFVTDSAGCLAELTRRPAQLVVLDAATAIATGESVKRIRGTPGHADVPIILLEDGSPMPATDKRTTSVQLHASPAEFFRALHAVWRA